MIRSYYHYSMGQYHAAMREAALRKRAYKYLSRNLSIDEFGYSITGGNLYSIYKSICWHRERATYWKEAAMNVSIDDRVMNERASKLGGGVGIG